MGNWKMFKTSRKQLLLQKNSRNYSSLRTCRPAICAPFTQLAALKEAFEGTGYQGRRAEYALRVKRAYTGEVSADMLNEIGIEYCIIGHSERRQYFNETDETVNKKLHTAFKHGIKPILCGR
jgi:triosephosphate isomerase